jgi:tape measure domain-containing protein
VDIATLGIAVDSRQVRTADRDLNKLKNTGSATERQTNQLGQAFRRIAAPLAAFLSARQIARSADAWTNLNNRLKLVTDGTAELVEAQDAVFSIAQRARQPLQSTAELYQRIAQNQDELGVSSAELVSVVDTISKSLAISGTTAESANAALIQLGQGFAAGTLRGEELNSVLEQAPALAQAIARGLNVPVGRLRELGQAGQLSARNIIDALLSQGNAVDDQFGRITATIDQATTTLGNSLTRVVGEIDQATGASKGFANQIISLSNSLDSGAFIDGALESFSLWRATIDATADASADLSNELQFLEDIGVGVADTLSDAFKDLPVNLRTAAQVIGVEIAAIVDRAKKRIKASKGSLLSGIVDPKEIAAINAAGKDIPKTREEALQAIFDEREAILSAAKADRDRREAEREDLIASRVEREKAIALLRSKTKTIDLSGNGVDTKAAEKLLALYERTEQSLAEQVALFGQVGEAAQIRYAIESGALVGINDEQQQRLLLLADELDTKQQLADQQEQLASLREATLTREEALLDELKARYAEIAELVQAGQLSQEEGAQIAARFAEQWKEATDAAKESTDEMSEFAKQAARNMQDAFADFLFDPFQDGLDGLLSNFGKILQRMAAEAASAAIFDSLGAAFGGGSGGGFGDVFAGLFDAGGRIPRGQFGIVGERGPELVSGPANVIGREQTAAMSRGTTVNLTQNFPGVRTEREARQAGGASAREINRIVSGAQRYA